MSLVLHDRPQHEKNLLSNFLYSCFFFHYHSFPKIHEFYTNYYVIWSFKIHFNSYGKYYEIITIERAYFIIMHSSTCILSTVILSFRHNLIFAYFCDYSYIATLTTLTPNQSILFWLLCHKMVRFKFNNCIF